MKTIIPRHGLSACISGLLPALLILVLPVGTVSASTWTGADGNWSSNVNPGWNGTGVPDSIGAIAVFGSSGSDTTTVDISARTVGAITYGGSGTNKRTISTASFGITLDQDGGGSGTVTISNTNSAVSASNGLLLTGAQSLTLADNLLIQNTGGSIASAANGSIEFDLVVAGAGNVTIDNVSNNIAQGSIRFSRANTFTGSVLIKKGAVSFNNATGLGNSGNAVTLGESGSGSASLISSAGVVAQQSITVGANSAGETRTLGSTSTVTGGYSGTILLNGDVTITSLSGSGHSMSLSSVVSGAGGIIKVASGIASLTNTGNTYSGNTTINDGTLKTNGIGSIAHGASKGNVVIDGGATVAGTLDIDAKDLTINGLVGTTGAVLGTVTNSGALKTLSVGSNDATAAFAGNITGALSLTKTGNGTQTLSGNNTYTGSTNINGGKLAIAGNQTGGGQLVVSNAATLAFGDGTSTNGSSVASGTIFVNNTGTVQINKANGGTVTNAIASNPSATTTLSGANAAGTTNTFTATSFNNGGGFAVTSTNAGAVLAFSSASGAIDLKGTNLSVSGAGDTLLTSAGVGFYSSTTSSKIIKQGTGTLIFKGNQGFTGNMEIDAGAVRVDIAQTNSGTYFVGNGTTTGTAAALLVGGGSDGLAGGVTFNRTISINPGNGTNRTVGGTNTTGTNTISSGLNMSGSFGEDRSVTLTAASGGTVDISGAVTGLGQNIIKTGSGTVMLSNTGNTYTGTTTVGTAAAGAANIVSPTANGGTLVVGAADALQSTAGIVVNNGGTLLLAGAGILNRVNNSAGLTLGTATGTGVGGTLALAAGVNVSEGVGAERNNPGGLSGTSSVGLGVLTLSSNSTLDFGTGGVGTLVFTIFVPGAFTLNILNYTSAASGNDLAQSGKSASDDRLIFNQDVSGAGFLNRISFNGVGAAQIPLDTGFYEIVPVPEPSTVFGALALLGLAGWRERRKGRLARQRERAAVLG